MSAQRGPLSGFPARPASPMSTPMRRTAPLHLALPRARSVLFTTLFAFLLLLTAGGPRVVEATTTARGAAMSSSDDGNDSSDAGPGPTTPAPPPVVTAAPPRTVDSSDSDAPSELPPTSTSGASSMTPAPMEPPTCSIELNCSNHASSVALEIVDGTTSSASGSVAANSVGGSRYRCSCNCTSMWSGSSCEVCPWKFNASVTASSADLSGKTPAEIDRTMTCAACSNGLFNYPSCVSARFVLIDNVSTTTKEWSMFSSDRVSVSSTVAGRGTFKNENEERYWQLVIGSEMSNWLNRPTGCLAAVSPSTGSASSSSSSSNRFKVGISVLSVVPPHPLTATSATAGSASGSGSGASSPTYPGLSFNASVVVTGPASAPDSSSSLSSSWMTGHSWSNEMETVGGCIARELSNVSAWPSLNKFLTNASMMQWLTVGSIEPAVLAVSMTSPCGSDETCVDTTVRSAADLPSINSPSQPTPPPSDDDDNTTLIIIIAASVGGVLLVGLVIGAVIVVKRRGDNRSDREERMAFADAANLDAALMAAPLGTVQQMMGDGGGPAPQRNGRDDDDFGNNTGRLHVPVLPGQESATSGGQGHEEDHGHSQRRGLGGEDGSTPDVELDRLLSDEEDEDVTANSSRLSGEKKKAAADHAVPLTPERRGSSGPRVDELDRMLSGGDVDDTLNDALI